MARGRLRMSARGDVGQCTICDKPMMPWLSPLKKFKGRLAHKKCKDLWFARVDHYRNG